MPRNDEVPPETSQHQVRRSTPPGAAVPTSRDAGGRHPPHPSPRHRVLHFNVPIIDGRAIVSVDSRGLLAAVRAGLDDGPVIFVDTDTDGNFFTDCRVPGEPFESLEQLIRAAGVHLLAASIRDLPQFEEEDHVGEHACPQTLQEHESVKDLLNTTTLEELSITATSSSSMQMQAQPWGCLSSLPIWASARFDWGITFYTRIDLTGFFHTYPHVGGPFKSLQEAECAIDRYLQERRDPTMFTKQPGVSRVDRLVRQCINWPDGTRKRLLKSQQIDERRDRMRQLVQALVDKYNDYRHLTGDRPYEFKDVVRYQSLLRGYGRSRSYYHINFTMKVKGADDSNCGIDDLFFAEITINRGECIEMVVSCFGMVKPTDNGHCYGCDVKHPNDAAAVYYHGEDSSQCACSRFGNMGWTGRDETLEEEEERVRRFYEAEGLDDPDYEETMNGQATVEVRTLAKTPYVWGGPTYSNIVGGS